MLKISSKYRMFPFGTVKKEEGIPPLIYTHSAIVLKGHTVGIKAI